MTEQLSKLSCRDFAMALASKQAVPGGGGAAALVGALAAALCSMVGNFTTGKKRYAEVETDIQRMLVDAEGLREKLLDLVDTDAIAFEPLSRAYAIPKEDPQRTTILETATQNACKAPLEMMQVCAQIIDLLDEMGKKGSRMLLSDVACGAYLAVAAMQSAAINVFVNTKSFRSSGWAIAAETDAKALLDVYPERGNLVARKIFDQLKR